MTMPWTDLVLSAAHARLLLEGLGYTLLLSLLAILAALPLGATLVWGSASRHGALRRPARGIVHLLRALPFLLVLLLVHFGTQKFLYRAPAVLTGTVALALYGSAYAAEAMRAALAGIARGQWEAAAALGLSRRAAFRKIVLPQMAVVFVPSGRVVAVMMLKESAVLSLITVPELTHAALRIQAETFQTVPTFLALTLCYWVAVSLLCRLIGLAEPRAGEGRAAPERPPPGFARLRAWVPRDRALSRS